MIATDTQARPTTFGMSFADRMQRAKDKQRQVLEFLASGEALSSRSVIQRVIGASPTRAKDLLKKMVDAGLLKSKEYKTATFKIVMYAITEDGIGTLAEADFAKAREPSWGEVSSVQLQHHLASQDVRLKVMGNEKFVSWTPTRFLRYETFGRMPDALLTMQGEKGPVKIAIEIERFAKSTRRYGEIVPAILADISKSRYDLVYFISPEDNIKAVMNSFKNTRKMYSNGEVLPVKKADFARFRFMNASTFSETMRIDQ